MPTRNPSDNWLVNNALTCDVQAASTTDVGTGIDTKGYEMALIIWDLGLSAGGTQELQVQTSATLGGTYVAIAAFTTAVTTANDNAQILHELDTRYMPDGQTFIRLSSETETAHALERAATIILTQSRDVGVGRYPATGVAVRVGVSIT